VTKAFFWLTAYQHLPTLLWCLCIFACLEQGERGFKVHAHGPYCTRNFVYCLAEHHVYQSNVSSFQLLMQAIQLIPENVMLRAQKRADEEPLRLDKNWVTACCIFVMWDISPVWRADIS